MQHGSYAGNPLLIHKGDRICREARMLKKRQSNYRSSEVDASTDLRSRTNEGAYAFTPTRISKAQRKIPRRTSTSSNSTSPRAEATELDSPVSRETVMLLILLLSFLATPLFMYVFLDPNFIFRCLLWRVTLIL
jgi:hypothetical protein